MNETRAPRQGEGITYRRERVPVDPRIWLVGALGFFTAVVALVAVTTLPYVSVKVQGADAGSVTLWRLDLTGSVLRDLGVEDEADPRSRKAIALDHAAADRRHRQVAEDLYRGYYPCLNNTPAEDTCENIKDLSRTLLVSQGKMLPSVSIALGAMLVIPITAMRASNQAIILTVVSCTVFVLLLAASANLGSNLHGRTRDVLEAAFPGVDVELKWGGGAVCLFFSAGVSGLYFVAALVVMMLTRNDAYPASDGPNYNDSNVWTAAPDP